MLINNNTTTKPLTKSLICNILDLPAPETDDTYTKVFFAHEVQPGGVAALSVNTSVVRTKTSTERQMELAEQAIKQGAKLLISTIQIKDYPCLIVDDILEAYCKIVIYIRSQFNPRTIAITGSIGKTTTTQMVYSVISYKYKTHRNDSSANNLRLASGIVQKLKPEHEFYVQETMEGPPYGAASDISKVVKPQAAIVTVVGTSHMEYFGSQKKILDSCLGVQDGMPDDGLLILNGDDSYQWNAKTKLKKVYYAIDNSEADYCATNIHSDGKSLAFDVVHDGRSTPVTIYCFGKHNVLNAVAAFAAGKWAGMTDEEIVAGLSKFRTEGIRQNLVFYGGKNLFLDCYNAAPESIKSSFESLMMIPVKDGGRRIAVLADIKESGEKEHEYHISVGKMVANSAIDLLVCYGKNAGLIASVVKTESSIPVYHTEKQDELVNYLKKNINNEDVVLFKGSHSMALEQAVDLAYGTWFHEVFDQYEFRTRIVNSKGLKYRVFPDHATVIEKISQSEDVVIPDYIEGVPVTGIGRSTFNGSRFTKSIKLPNTIVNIRYLAFYQANHIKTIEIPNSIRIIDESSFNGCKSLTTVNIGNGCTHIGYHAFANCINLERITIPSSVMQIGKDAFLNCSKLAIYCVKSSYAEKYAIENKIPYVSSDPVEEICSEKEESVLEIVDNIDKDEKIFKDLWTRRKDDIIRYVKDNEESRRMSMLMDYYLKGYTGKIKTEVRPLLENQKQELDRVWEKYKKVGLYNDKWNEIYTSITGGFDPYYIPQSLHYLYVEKSRLDRSYQIAFSDKNYLSLLFPTIKKPVTIARKMEGYYYDADYNPISKDEVKKRIQEQLYQSVVIKKSRESSAGKGVYFLTSASTDNDIDTVLNMSNDLQIQKCIGQHPAMKRLNSSSVNTIRIMTIMIDGKVEVLSGVVRIGQDGSLVDNFSRGGYCCGIKEDGSLTTYGYKDTGERFLYHTNGICFADEKIPNYSSIIETVKRQHYYVPMLGIISWDVCVGEDGEPVLIEINVGEGGIAVHQYNNGPIYGKFREKVLNDTFENTFDRGAELGYSYRCYLDRAVIEKGSNCIESIAFPDTICKRPMTRIGSNAFSRCNKLRAISLPSTVNSVGEAAFFSCRNLKTIILNEGLEIIERNAFNECMSVEEITIPNTVTTIGIRAFWDCHKLSKVKIPRGTTYIGKNAFGHSPNVVINCEAGSYAEQYAKENGIPYLAD